MLFEYIGADSGEGHTNAPSTTDLMLQPGGCALGLSPPYPRIPASLSMGYTSPLISRTLPIHLVIPYIKESPLRSLLRQRNHSVPFRRNITHAG